MANPTYTLDYDGNISGGAGRNYGNVVGVNILNPDASVQYVPTTSPVWAALVAPGGPLAGTSLVSIQAPLLNLKLAAIAAVRLKTATLLQAGFTVGSHQFGMDPQSLIKWLTLDMLLGHALIAFPFAVGPTLDDNSSVAIAAAANWTAFLTAYKTRHTAILGGPGTGGEADLISQIAVASTPAAVVAVVDART